MGRYIIARHFINGEDTLAEFAIGVDKLRIAMDISAFDTSNLGFGLKLTLDGKRIGPDLQDRIKQQIAKLPGNLLFLLDPEDRGPGTSYKQVLFNPTFFSHNPTTLISLDLDQYIINTPESLGRIADLAERVEKEEALYATGSRDVSVILATNQRNSDLRIIHELFHSLIIGTNKLRIEDQSKKVTPAYAEIGECTTGLYVLNMSHKAFPILLSAIAQASQMANMDGFATDYYVAIRASQLARLSRGYVCSRENKFYSKKDKHQEFESVKRLISGQTAELGKTDISGLLRRTLQDPTNARRIAEFYLPEDVELVRHLMIEALPKD